MFKVLRPARYVWYYLKEVSGENAYERYVEKHRVTHPEKEPLKRGEFYRWRQDALYNNLGSRCP